MLTTSIKNKIKKSLLISGTSALLMAGLLPNTATLVQAAAPEIKANASMTVDFETGQILQGNNIDEVVGIASMTKMLVEYIVFQEIEAGTIDWDTEITVSQYAYEISQNYSLSNTALRNGGVYSLRELYEGMAIYSANGATIAIAEHIEGTEPAFVDRMKELAESFGIEDAVLYNSTGLNNKDLNGVLYPGSSDTDENMMSSRSIAIIANRIIEDYPEILETASIPKKTFRPDTIDAIEMVNWNWMLEGLIREREGVDGLKTGTTEFAGATFAGTATQNDRRLITVVMDTEEENQIARFVETDRMMDYGFDNFKTENVTDQWKQIFDYEPLAVVNGREKTVNFEASESLEMLMELQHSADENISYSIEWDKNIVTEEGVGAPFEEGLELGRLIVTYEGNEHGFLDGDQTKSVPLVTSKAVDKANVFIRFWNWLGGLITSITSRF